MIKYVIAFLFSVGLLNARDNIGQVDIYLKVGDVFEMGKPKTNTYGHMDFPKVNFIIKHGVIANYQRIAGEKVVVTSAKEREDGSIKVKIERTNGSTFFGSHSIVAANFDDELKTGGQRKL